MSRQQNPNLELLLLVVNQLGELADNMVFIGGCATGLLITDNAAPPIRVTRDVDAMKKIHHHNKQVQFIINNKTQTVKLPTESAWDSFFLSKNKASEDFMIEKASQYQAERENFDD